MKKLLIGLIIGVFLVLSIGTVMAAPEKAKGVHKRPQRGVAIWTGNGGFISWWPEDYSSHYICKGTSKLPQKAINNMTSEGWWISYQGLNGAETICKQAY